MSSRDRHQRGRGCGVTGRVRRICGRHPAAWLRPVRPDRVASGTKTGPSETSSMALRRLFAPRNLPPRPKPQTTGSGGGDPASPAPVSVGRRVAGVWVEQARRDRTRQDSGTETSSSWLFAEIPAMRAATCRARHRTTTPSRSRTCGSGRGAALLELRRPSARASAARRPRRRGRTPEPPRRPSKCVRTLAPPSPRRPTGPRNVGPLEPTSIASRRASRPHWNRPPTASPQLVRDHSHRCSPPGAPASVNAPPTPRYIRITSNQDALTHAAYGSADRPGPTGPLGPH